MRRHRGQILRRRLREVTRSVLDALCPARCAACGIVADGICDHCRDGLRRRLPPLCPRCGEPADPELAPGCRADHGWLRGIEFARAPFAYRDTGGAIVRRLKFDHDPAAGAVLGRAMAACLWGWARASGRRALLVAVPLHPNKRRARGHDQAAWLADSVARQLGLEYLPAALRRCLDTMPQGDPRVRSRAANVAGAFVVRRPAAVVGRFIVLVDDVVTSGETARECSRVLRAAGARGVVLLTAAFAGRRAEPTLAVDPVRR